MVRFGPRLGAVLVTLGSVLFTVPGATAADDGGGDSVSIAPPYATSSSYFRCDGILCAGDAIADAASGNLAIQLENTGVGVGLACFGVCVPHECSSGQAVARTAVVGETDFPAVPTRWMRAVVPLVVDAGHVRHIGRCMPADVEVIIIVSAFCGVVREPVSAHPCSIKQPLVLATSANSPFYETSIPPVSAAAELQAPPGEMILPGRTSVRVELSAKVTSGTARTEMDLAFSAPRIDLLTEAS